ncbi:hypothetical protein [Streptomyces sp. NPDC005732]|uniref:hypothetical protein n=1 Tax=Streptomyces sp. NPDC005732 TaxID=3157057 RepID=UPI0033EBC420
MIDESPLPAGWRALAVPSDWDLDEAELRIRPVTIDYVTYPDDFLMIIQCPEMIHASVPTAIFASFKASEARGVELVKIFGMGPDWLMWLGFVVQKFPPTEWTKRAQSTVVQFLQMPEIRKALVEAGIPMPEAETAASQPAEAGVQKRRRITVDHLSEVARIYREAQWRDDPPTRAVQEYFGVSHSTAAKWVGAARKNDLLPPVD